MTSFPISGTVKFILSYQNQSCSLYFILQAVKYSSVPAVPKRQEGFLRLARFFQFMLSIVSSGYLINRIFDFLKELKEYQHNCTIMTDCDEKVNKFLRDKSFLFMMYKL